MFLFIGLIAFHKITSTESKLRTQVTLLAEKNLLLLEQANEINQLAYHDTLTGLPNRHYFQQVLSEALTGTGADSAGGAVAFLDLDNFKLVNDTYGHDVGDQFLAVIADRIKSLLQEQVFGARFGGDEFVFLLRQFEDANTRMLLEKILALVALPVQVEGVMISPTCSIGVAFFPSHGNSVVELLKKADTAMYQAKARKNIYVIYDGKALEEIADRQRMEQSLRRAIDRQELSLAYQPIINSVSHKLVGLEALLRWRSGEYGEISPAKFIPLAESSGMIVPIGQWVLNEAAAMVKLLQDTGLRHIYISVNVSVIQFMQDDFLAIINNSVTTNNVPVDNIKIEITETVLIESFAHIKAKIDRVREMGIKICLDDFGTGYSSINYLTQLPLDVLKLDQSLVGRLEGDARAQAVFENMVRMAHGIGIQVVAEGVENSRQMELIQKLGCDYAQGYYISRPVPQTVLLTELAQGTSYSFTLQANGSNALQGYTGINERKSN